MNSEGDIILKTFVKPDGDSRIHIVRRPDGRYSFCTQSLDRSGQYSTTAWRPGYPREAGWGPPGPYLGIYDSAETAKWEALGNVKWLVDTQPGN